MFVVFYASYRFSNYNLLIRLSTYVITVIIHGSGVDRKCNTARAYVDTRAYCSVLFLNKFIINKSFL